MVDCTGLENRQRATVREFESHRFRQLIELIPYFKGGQKAPLLARLKKSCRCGMASGVSGQTRKISGSSSRRFQRPCRREVRLWFGQNLRSSQARR
ncbi:hypothetical protein THICB6_60353 [Thiomonas arsenitoxydans]|nr:hypothetical protein THICB6_60353 [Thiomonas arsenitoxydans]CQR43415.1 hypothetical protein THICB3320465 [Thiomonas sp. CB3]